MLSPLAWSDGLHAADFRRIADLRYKPRTSGSATSATDSLWPTRAPSHTRSTPARAGARGPGASAVAYSV